MRRLVFWLVRWICDRDDFDYGGGDPRRPHAVIEADASSADGLDRAAARIRRIAEGRP